MGCSPSKLHPKYAELYKLRKKYDTSPIQAKKLVQVWVLGAIPGSVRELASSVANRCDFMLLSASDIVTFEGTLETDRGALVNSVLQDGCNLPPEITTDLVTELLLEKIEGIRGVVMIGVPSCKNQGDTFEKLIGPVSLIIYMEIKCTALKTMLLSSGDDEETVRNKLRSFHKNIIPLTRHKKAIKVNGDKDANFCLEECKEHLDELARA